VRERFPDAILVERRVRRLGVVVAEPYSAEARARHEAAGKAVGWKGDIVDFPHATADCKLVFPDKFY
jgi:hypothetical protein